MKVRGALQPFIGKQIKDVADQIQAYAARHGNTVNIIDPKFNISNIDYNPTRLNVHVDASAVVTGFIFG